MPPPTHKIGCETKMYPTTCHDCGAEVYYFTCTCDSRVFFELNHYPWHPHADRCIPYLLRILTSNEGLSVTDIRNHVQAVAHRLNRSIPDSVLQHLTHLEQRTGIQLTITTVTPTPNYPPVLAKIISVTRGINFFKRFDYQNNDAGKQLLGMLSKEDYAEIHLREEPDDHNRCREFKVFVKHSLINEFNLRNETEVCITLQAYQVLGRKSIWLVQKIEIS